MRKTSKNKNRVKITHGIYHYTVCFSCNQRWDIYCRNTDKYLPLPLKFKEFLKQKYLEWWYVKTSVYRFKKRIPIRCLVDMPIEFTIAHDPNNDIWVIAITHPLDQFKRKTGAKMVKDRMEFAQKYPNNSYKWSFKLI